MVSGEFVGAVAMTEPGFGSDLKGVRTCAVRDGDHYVLNGSKTFITNASHADVVVARTSERDRRPGTRASCPSSVNTDRLDGF